MRQTFDGTILAFLRFKGIIPNTVRELPDVWKVIVEELGENPTVSQDKSKLTALLGSYRLLKSQGSQQSQFSVDALTLFSFIRLGDKLPDPELVLKGTPNVLKDYVREHELGSDLLYSWYSLLYDAFVKGEITEERAVNFGKFFFDLDVPSFAVMTMADILSVFPKMVKTETYSKFVEKYAGYVLSPPATSALPKEKEEPDSAETVKEE